MQQKIANDFFSPSSSLLLDKSFWMIDLRRLEEKFLWTDIFFSSLPFLLLLPEVFFHKCFMNE